MTSNREASRQRRIEREFRYAGGYTVQRPTRGRIAPKEPPPEGYAVVQHGGLVPQHAPLRVWSDGRWQPARVDGGGRRNRASIDLRVLDSDDRRAEEVDHGRFPVCRIACQLGAPDGTGDGWKP